VGQTTAVRRPTARSKSNSKPDEREAGTPVTGDDMETVISDIISLVKGLLGWLLGPLQLAVFLLIGYVFVKAFDASIAGYFRSIDDRFNQIESLLRETQASVDRLRQKYFD
jgi:hypothetical protein